jgi:hypothetical protein
VICELQPLDGLTHRQSGSGDDKINPCLCQGPNSLRVAQKLVDLLTKPLLYVTNYFRVDLHSSSNIPYRTEDMTKFDNENVINI